MIAASDALSYIQKLRNGPTTTYLNEMFKEADKISADKLEVERKTRLVIFFRGFGNEATLDEVQATLVS